MKLKFSLMTLLFFIFTAFSFAETIGDLKVSSNHRTLEYKDTNKTFNWIGDTAWDLSIKLSSSDMRKYLDDRKSKGFTIIQVAASGGQDKDKDGLYKIGKDADGNSPFSNIEAGTLNEEFWAHVDLLIDRAANRGLYIALLPTWGNALSDHNVSAYNYGRNLGARYKNKKNIIWVLGGDVDFDTDTHKTIWNNLANGIKSQDTRHLMTYHPNRDMDGTNTYGNNAKDLHGQSWLDFVMVQSGHQWTSLTTVNPKITQALTYGMSPGHTQKPIIDGEPRYEDIGFINNHEIYVHPSKNARSIAYLDLFSGTFGHTYGHNAIWQMAEGVCGHLGCTENNTWQDALNADGGVQMGYLKTFIANYLNRIPDQSIIHSGTATASRAVNGTYILVYLPYGTSSIRLNMGKIPEDTLHYKWFNPITGETTDGDTITNATGTQQTIAHDDASHDWVLVLKKNTTPACTDRASLSSPTSGIIDKSHTFTWNKPSCVKKVSLYVHDVTSDVEVPNSRYTGSALTKTVNNMHASHTIKVTLKSFNQADQKIGNSRYYYFTVKNTPACKSKPTLSYQTSGTIDPTHKFAWNKDTSCVDQVLLSVRDTTSNSQAGLYKGTAWNYTVTDMHYSHNIKATLTGYDKTGRVTGTSNYYFKVKNTPVCTSRPTLSYQTSGTIDPTHKFAWNKDTSCVNEVHLYVHDITTNKKVSSYAGTDWNYMVKNMSSGHKIKVTLKGYDKTGRPTGDSRYYYFTVKSLPPVTQKAYLTSPKNGSSYSHATTLNGTTTFSVKRYANEVIRFRIYDATARKYLYTSGLTTRTSYRYNLPKDGHKIYIYIYSYDATRNNKYIGVNAYYNFKNATDITPPKIQNHNAYLVYQTQGNISTTHKFAWNKKSSVKYVSLYIWDRTAHRGIKYYKGTAWNQTVGHLPKGHKLEIILKSYDSHNRKMGGSNYYYFTVK